MRFAKCLMCAALALGLSIVASYGSPNIRTFDASGDTSDWVIKDQSGGAAIGNLSWVDQGGSHGGVLQDSFTRPVSPDPAYFEIMYTTDNDLLTAAVAGGSSSIMFDFYSAGTKPQEVYAFFETASGDAWFRDVSSYIVDTGWGHANAYLGWGSWFNMSDPVRGVGDFAGDLAAISQIGVMVYYRDVAGAQIYAIDNFDVDYNLNIPEPETWAFLGIAFLSIGYSFRERLDKAMSDLMVRIRG